MHRDLKPGNIFLSAPDDGMVKLLDFGIAKETGSSRVVQGETTTTGQLLGSPHYMSPEQARGQSLDGRSDLWSVAVILFRVLTGHRPFDGDDIGDLIVRICTEAVPPASGFKPELGADVDAFFTRAFERDVEKRFPDARTFAEAFRVALSPQLGANVSGSWDRMSAPMPPADGVLDTFPSGSGITSSSSRMAAVLRPGPDTLDTLAATTAPSRSRAAWVGGAVALVAAIGIGGALVATSAGSTQVPSPAGSTLSGGAVDGAAPTAEATSEAPAEEPEPPAAEPAEPEAETPEKADPTPSATPRPRPVLRVPRPVPAQPRPRPAPPPPKGPDLGY